MESFYVLVNDYANKWRKVLTKQQYCDEFGSLSEDDIALHNGDVLSLTEYLMDAVKRLNELIPDELVFNEETRKYSLPQKLTEDEVNEIALILKNTENLEEKDFISIF